MSVGLSGNLGDFGIADVFQLIGQQRKTGTLELRNGGARVLLVFERGLIVSAVPATTRATDLDPVAERMVRCGLLVRERASQGLSASRAGARSFARTAVERGWVSAEDAEATVGLVTRDTIFEVLRWTAGTFDFRAQDVSHDLDHSKLLGAEQILMDGLRMVDEWQSFAGQVPSEDTVFQRVSGFERFTERAEPISEEERALAERVFGLIDGRLSTRRVIDLARIGTFDGTRCLADLRRVGAIRPLNPEGVRRVRRHLRGSASRSAAIRQGLAALATIVALACVVWWTTGSDASAASAPAGRIERHGFASLRGAYATHAVQNASGAYQLDHGAWPADLAALERAGLVDPDALAAPESRPYYSRNREQESIILAPER